MDAFKYIFEFIQELKQKRKNDEYKNIDALKKAEEEIRVKLQGIKDEKKKE